MKNSFLTLCLLVAGCARQSDHPHVRIANVAGGLQTLYMPVALAETLGYYKEEGLDVDLENLPGGVKALQALIGGSVDVADFPYEHNLMVAAEGQHVRAFFVVTQRDSKMLIIAPKASGRVHRAEDLKGATIGVSSPGSATHQLAVYYLGSHGIQPTEFSAVGIGLGPTAIAAIESGRVDAAGILVADYLNLLRRHPDLRVLSNGATPEGMHELYGDVGYAGGAVSAKPEWLNRNPETARRIGRALQRTLKWIAGHSPEEIRAQLAETFRSKDVALDVAVIRWGMDTFTPDGRMPKGAPQTMKHFLDATTPEVRNAKFDLAATWTDEFLTGTK